MPLLKHGSPVGEDAWTVVADDEGLPADGAVVISWDRYRRERDTLLGRNAPLGLAIPNDADVQELGADANRFGAIFLRFPKFNDGRAFSQARLLRERLGFAGELRATGDVLRDQVLFMLRCGFDALEFADAAAFDAAVAEFTTFYQPTADGRATALQRRLARAVA
jgi:uncharacterized protein (DUF934 family)